MTEHDAARKLTAALRKQGAYVWKINANFAGGIPDMWIAGNGSDLWLELKAIKTLPKRASTIIVPNLSAQQLHWLEARALQGVRVGVALATQEGWLFFDHPNEWRGSVTANEARTRLLSLGEVTKTICRLVGIPEVLRNEPANTLAVDAGANGAYTLIARQPKSGGSSGAPAVAH